ncbi:FAD dependent oxidoreductase [Tamaricihabitans halophyticus]|uniref:FAD dependent oxidoreductase n=1 Tax=Tamaricihabitans halophyticus TaxID=1262583 RepID=A0A4R2QKT6_9PSEU|nr:FAD-dependent oxidoreductase [Tamaricihabitans halophyticus]TCP49947.1 FAD dependent oxidoreductase [Tamaricihabitans halophyticus]
MEHLGDYDVIVAGAGVTGIVASVAAARAGATVLLVESSGILGGLITGGRLTKPTGVVQPGVYLDLIERAAAYGGADPNLRESHWGAYSGVFDTEVMQRVIIETIEEAGVEVLLFAHVTAAVRGGDRVRGVELHTKAGPQLATASTVIDASGDGDVAALAGVDFSYGRPSDGHVQPMTSYFRILNVQFAELAKDCLEHPEDIRELVIPEGAGQDNADYVLKFYMAGFEQRIADARREGFEWIIPKSHLHMKAGLLPGELNVNATRVQGNALDPRTRTSAALEVRKQAYCAFDFLKRYVRGAESAIFLDVAPVLGVRETRRMVGDYVLTEEDVRSQARFDDAIGLSNAPLDIHEPGGEGGAMITVNDGYGVPYRCLLPRGVEGLLIAGRCLSVDSGAFASTRNTPVCAITAQAAGIAAAECASRQVTPRELPVDAVQRQLTAIGVSLGN